MASTGAAIQVIDFVRALAMAWKNLAAYPRTHPAVVSSLQAAEARLTELRGPAGEVTLGIASNSLVYGSMTIDSAAAQKLAFALYARGVAMLRFGTETTGQELESFLRLLAASTPGHDRRPIWEEITAAGVVNINLQPVAYGAVQLSEDLSQAPKPEAEEPIWDSILRALLEGGRFADGARALATVASVDELSRMLSEFVDADRPEAVPRDFDATFGIRVSTREQRMATLCSFIERTFGERLRSGPGQGLQNSLEQGVQLLAALAQPIRSVVLGGIIRALGGDETPLAVLRQFTSTLPNDEVLEALRYLSSVGDLSPHAALLLKALTQSNPETVPEAAPERSAVASLVALFGNDDVDRFNPPDHRELLESVAIRIPEVPEDAVRALAELGTRAGTVASAVVERQVATVLLDLLAVAEPGRAVESALARIEQTFRAWLERGAYDEASTLLDDLHAVAAGGSAGLKVAIEAHIGAGSRIPALIESILASEAEKLPMLRRIVTTLGPPALRHLLAALAEEGDLSRRRRLFDFIASLGPVIVPPAIEFLGDSRWYVVRNMIALLRVLEDRTSIPEVRKLGRHEDLRVRMEAIKSLFALDGNVPTNLLDDLFAHPDAKLAQGAVALVGAYKMKEGVDPLLRILSERDLLGGARMIRLKAIRALGEIGDPRALPALGGFFGGSWLPWPAREERLAAWQSLSHYPPAARAPFVEKGLKSRDGEIRAICARLAKR